MRRMSSTHNLSPTIRLGSKGSSSSRGKRWGCMHAAEWLGLVAAQSAARSLDSDIALETLKESPELTAILLGSMQHSTLESLQHRLY
jgi:hypothetical protein